MKLHRFAAVVLALMLSGLPAAVPVQGGARSPIAPPQPMVTTITTRLPAGQGALVAVTTNPSTGYHWQVGPVAGVKVSYLDFPTRTLDPQHPMVGVPLIRVYVLTALKARAAPYVVRLVELSPAGRPSGSRVVVTITALP